MAAGKSPAATAVTPEAAMELREVVSATEETLREVLTALTAAPAEDSVRVVTVRAAAALLAAKESRTPTPATAAERVQAESAAATTAVDRVPENVSLLPFLAAESVLPTEVTEVIAVRDEARLVAGAEVMREPVAAAAITEAEVVREAGKEKEGPDKSKER